MLGYLTDKGIDSNNKEWTAGYSLEDTVIEAVNKVLVTGLTLNINYYYKVGTETHGYSPVGTFTTAGVANEDKDFCFIYYTDT